MVRGLTARANSVYGIPNNCRRPSLSQLRKSSSRTTGHIGTILRRLNADYQDVCKVTTVYEDGCSHDDLHENLSIRSSYFEDPGPVTTGIPLPKLAYPAMVIEIEIFAMADPDG